MLNAIVWGLVQGLTEFLPISSSGHLVLVPAFLGLEPPDLATSAFLHLGTLVAVVAYYRRDLARLGRFRRDPVSRHVLFLLVVGTLPALIGVVVEAPLERLQDSPTAVAVALLGTGVVLAASTRLPPRRRRLEDATGGQAVGVGISQAVALIPGVSRSGMTITTGLAAGLAPVEAARFSFLLGVPAIAGAGLLEAVELAEVGGLRPELGVGLAVAALSGYAAIALLLRALTRYGLGPFSVYCLVVGVVALVVL